MNLKWCKCKFKVNSSNLAFVKPRELLCHGKYSVQWHLRAVFHRFESQAVPKQQNFPQTCVSSHLRYPSAITRLSSVSPVMFLLSRNQRALLPAGSSVPAAQAARQCTMCVPGLLFCQWEH